MNRTTAAALVTTAVIGVSAGTVTAVVRGEDPAGKSPAAQSPGSPTAPATARDEVLWSDGRSIHDGERKVAVTGVPATTPDRLVRADGGYLLGFTTLGGERDEDARTRLFHVSADTGAAVELGTARAWDLNGPGDQVAMVRAADGTIVNVGVDGEERARWAGPRGRVGLVWTGTEVGVHSFDPELPAWAVHVWTPDTGESRRTSRVGYDHVVGDREGRQLFGRVNAEGSSADDENYCAGTQPAPGEASQVTWFTCDWRLNGPRLNPVSPAGSRLLVVHSQSDGFGPGAFGVVEVAEGPRAGVPTIDAPQDWMMDAAWVDEDHFAIVGSNSDAVGEVGGWVELCDLEGKCEEVGHTTTGGVVLGEQF